MSLPLLPSQHVAQVFDTLAANVGQVEAAQELVNYVQDQWVQSRTFPPANWSAYRQPIHTNNDVEGWHYRMNHKGKRGKYIFIFI